MTRFAWAPWGLLVVVLDLPLLDTGWDVLPDVVGYLWLVAALAGAATVHPAFVRARAAALVGAPISIITGTPLFVGEQWGAVLFGGLVLGVLAWVVVVHQLLTGLLAVAPEGQEEVLRWAGPLRIAAPVVGLVQVAGIVLVQTPLQVLYSIAFLASVVVGVLTVVLLHRVNRAGWFATTTNAPA